MCETPLFAKTKLMMSPVTALTELGVKVRPSLPTWTSKVVCEKRRGGLGKEEGRKGREEGEERGTKGEDESWSEEESEGGEEGEDLDHRG